ncbi:DNA translocase FtsK [Ammoniphilus sp. CFH 90114]|uniref:DNA translocase FtsK n=1 Tax=Ammoniphilus sp. CFH 90114 TaxID=2493665 RepID=UPI00100F28DB|nr:DNA translocase FtsK [Ammoniphilus sp. CFH 90114]RXT13455.1 DNA translocase FtsK [Ammoniphilus sp. CFH 90114]
MKKWWKRISEALSSESEDKETKIESEQPSERWKPEAQVRTRTVYPKNQGSSHFRFPMIPDDVESTRGNPPSRGNVSHSTPPRKPNVTRSPQTPERVIQSDVKREQKAKPAFKPTTIVSPIHGTMRVDGNSPRNLDSFVHTGIVQQKTESQSQTIESKLHEPQVLVKEELANEEIATTKEALSEKLEATVVPIEEKSLDLEITVPSEPSEPIRIRSVLLDSPVNDNDQPLIEAQAITVSLPDLMVEPTECTTTVSPSSFDPDLETTEPILTETRATPAPYVPSYLQGVRSSTPVEEKNLPRALGNFYSSTKVHQSNSTHDVNMYHMPSIHLLRKEPPLQGNDDEYTDEQIQKLSVALENFHVNADVVGVVKGPTVTRYELQPAPGVKVNKFTNLIDDIKLALAAKDIRMEAPIPGRSAIGIEVPNEQPSPVFIRSILESQEFRSNPSPLAIALGRDIGGAPIIGDLKKMPHGLIAGSTGSGKSVCINSILVSLLYKAKPSDVRLILIDPKVVELAPYNHIPHLLTPVVTDPKQATAALRWAVEEMDSRYEKFADKGVRDIERFNHTAQQEGMEKLPYIIIIIDELADLMMVAPGDVEEAICRIAQKARACGIHLLVATQRPSVDVITGLIKANIPTRIAFAVSSGADSRTILDMGGAERLLGKGDMLYYPSGLAKPIRLQGNFVSDEEIEMVVEHVKKQQKVNYLFDKEQLTRAVQASSESEDELFEEALLFMVEQGQASASSLQRRFRIGYNRAARLIDMMESEGFIAGQSGSKAREVLISEEDYRNMFG